MRRTGAAVEDDERCRRRGVAGPQVAGHAVPRLRLSSSASGKATVPSRTSIVCDSTSARVVHTFHGFHSRLRLPERRRRVARHW